MNDHLAELQEMVEGLRPHIKPEGTLAYQRLMERLTLLRTAPPVSVMFEAERLINEKIRQQTAGILVKEGTKAKIRAIKFLREQTRLDTGRTLSLKICKQYVEDLQAIIKGSGARKKTATVLSPEQTKAVQHLVDNEHWIQAVKYIKHECGISLCEAKALVDPYRH